jgi:hypothetical protein
MSQMDKAEKHTREATSWHFKGSRVRRRWVKKFWRKARRRIGKLMKEERDG